MKKSLVFISLCFCVLPSLLANTWYVNVHTGSDGYDGTSPVYIPYTNQGPKQTIHQAVMLAAPNELIIVADGMYAGQENYGDNIIQKSVTIRSANGPDNCIINTMAVPVPFQFDGGLNYQNGPFVLDGFTIINAREKVIWINSEYQHTPQFRNCVIRDCTVRQAAIYLENHAEIIMDGCSIYDIVGQQTYDTICDILCTQESHATITDCYLEGPAQDSLPYSAAVICRDYSEADITGSTLTHSWGVGLCLEMGGTCTIENSEISWNWSGGILCENADEFNPIELTVSSCDLFGNWGALGAAVRIKRYVNAAITDCDITDNWVDPTGNMNPPDMPCVVSNIGGSMTLERCRMNNNWSDPMQYSPRVVYSLFENGMDSFYNMEIVDCDIRHNETLIGISLFGYNQEPQSTLVKNTLVAYNRIGIFAGGINTTIANCSVVANGFEPFNSPTTGIWLNNQMSTAEISNSIVYGNNGPQSQIYSDQPYGVMVRYCDVQHGWLMEGGVGNIDADPMFADAYLDEYQEMIYGEDFHLKSVAGRYDPANDTWGNDDVTSPCIDTGDPNSDYSLEPDPSGTGINMGAYGGTVFASMSPNGPRPYCTQFVAADLNKDCRVNFADMAQIAAAWLDCYLEPASACNE